MSTTPHYSKVVTHAGCKQFDAYLDEDGARLRIEQPNARSNRWHIRLQYYTDTGREEITDLASNLRRTDAERWAAHILNRVVSCTPGGQPNFVESLPFAPFWDWRPPYEMPKLDINNAWAGNILEPGNILSDRFILLNTEYCKAPKLLDKLRRPPKRVVQILPQAAGQRIWDSFEHSKSVRLDALGIDGRMAYFADPNDAPYFVDPARLGLAHAVTGFDTAWGIDPREIISLFRGSTMVARIMPMHLLPDSPALPAVAALREQCGRHNRTAANLSPLF